ncbi:hypothetical protein M408DRAFT_133210 [Serendipita vermifera MAFF 305830]|uniref:Uncharacterized protein n=1 Tax=Serendipita vermifera MAFF 305830 TaxID=933852 RepID=A0A0C3BBE2_SERVB|nr:hypothetical protein M408DRAFT_133210 [Serendipita vermifera MAFF 305830]
MDPQNDESLEPEGGSVGTSSREDAVVEGSIEEEDASGGEVASDEDDVVEEHVEENFPIPANLNMEEAAFRGNHASSSFHSNMVEDAGPSPEGLNQKIEPFIQEVNPPSPIQPTMILRRKLRDADTFRQRLLQMPVLTGTTPIPGKDIPPTEFSQEKGGSLVQSQVSTRLQISASTNQPGVSSPHAVSGSSHTFKKDLFNELEDQVGPSRPPLNIKNTGWQKGPEKQKAVQNLKNATKAVDKKKPPRHRPPPPVTTDDESDSETDQSRSPTPPKSELDEIADVLTSIQDTILNKINGKFSGVRREARLARTHLLENAVVDLEVMQENHEKSLARFMKLEEKCGEVTQQIIGDLAELQVANDAIVNNLRGIIQEHDEVTAATKAARKPLFPKLPACLEK